jgi:cytochrome c2
MGTYNSVKKSIVTSAQGNPSYLFSCHHLTLNTLSPPLGDIYGKSSASIKGYLYYSPRCKSLSYRWSRHRLYKLMCKN